MSTEQEHDETATAARRIHGIDAARGIAIIGMVAVHAGPVDAGGVAGWVYGLPHGRASVLFVLLAGVGVSLLAGDRSRRRVRRARLDLLWRAVLLLPLGLALQPLDHGVLVILQAFAAFFLLAAALVRADDHVLLFGAGAATIGGPLVQLWLDRLSPDLLDSPAVLGDPPQTVAVDLLLAGSYPLAVWAAPLLIGMWLGRRGLREQGLAHRLVGVGTTVAVTAWVAGQGLSMVGEDAEGWWRLADVSAHSGMPLWILGATGSAAAVLGVALLADARWPHLLWPLAAYGQLALSVYVGHLLVLHAIPELLAARDDLPLAALRVVRFTVMSVAVTVAWRALLPRGPLELLMRRPRRRR